MISLSHRKTYDVKKAQQILKILITQKNVGSAYNHRTTIWHRLYNRLTTAPRYLRKPLKTGLRLSKN